MKTYTKQVSVFSLYFACEREMKHNQTEQARAMFLRLHKKKCAKCRAEAKEKYGSKQKWDAMRDQSYEDFEEKGLKTTNAVCVGTFNGKSQMTYASSKHKCSKGTLVAAVAHNLE